MRTINKFTYTQKKAEVKVEYTETIAGENSTDEVKMSLTSYDKPKPELCALLNTLTRDVEEICRLPVGYCVLSEIRGVSFSWTNDVMGAVITCLVKVETANSPVVINTPHLSSEQYSDGGKSPILDSSTTFKLKQLLKLIGEYIDGDRVKENENQLNLFETKATDGTAQ
jgi:hypothetical protein